MRETLIKRNLYYRVASIHEEADRLVAERLDAYDGVVADLYFMAACVGDRETQRGIWDEAWAHHNLHLLALLLLTETALFDLC